MTLFGGVVKRRLFNVAAGLSVLVWIAAVVLWARSFWAGDIFQVIHHTVGRNNGLIQGGSVLTRDISIVSIKHRFILTYQTIWNNETREGAAEREASPLIGSHLRFPLHLDYSGQGTSFWNRIGFEYWHSSPVPQVTNFFIRNWSVPVWLPLLVSAVLPMIWIIRYWMRVKPGFCTTCGYDLRATPDRCPECGTNVKQTDGDPTNS